MKKTKRRKGKRTSFIPVRRILLPSFTAVCLLFNAFIGRCQDETAAFFVHKGLEFFNEGVLDSAAHYFLQANLTARVDEDIESLTSSCNFLGKIDAQLGLHSSARRYFRQLEDLGFANSKPLVIADAWNNLGASYYDTGSLDSASYYFSKSIAIVDSVGDITRANQYLNNQAVLALESADLVTAKQLLHEVKARAKSNSDGMTELSATLNLGVVFLNEDEFDSSIFHLQEARDMSVVLNIPHHELVTILNLGDLHYNFDKYEDAADYYWEYHLLHDSLFSANAGKEIQELKLKFDSSQTDLALKESQLHSVQRSRLFIGITSFLLLAIITGILVYYRHRSVHRARTQALLEAREEENKRITDLLWKEIGSAVKEKKLVLPGVELPEQSIGGAIEAAKFLANQQYNPFLQLGLKRAVEHLATSTEERTSFKVFVEVDDIHLDKTVRLAVYRVIENLVLDISEQQDEGEINIGLKADNGRIHITVGSDQIKNSKSMLFKSAEARVAQLKGKINRSSNRDRQLSEVQLALKDLK